MSKPVAPDNTARTCWRWAIGEANGMRCDGFTQTQHTTFGSSCQGAHLGHIVPDDGYLFYAIAISLQAPTGILRECPFVLQPAICGIGSLLMLASASPPQRAAIGSRQAAHRQPLPYSVRSRYAAIFARTFRPRRTFASAVLPADFCMQCTYGLDSSRAAWTGLPSAASVSQKNAFA
jgi:hypothetical protein